jgi:hypothetical protein
MPWQIFDVLVRFIDNFCEFLPIDDFLVDIHGDPVVKIGEAEGIVPDDLRDSRAPETVSPWY